MRYGEWTAMGGADNDGVRRFSLLGFDGPVVHGWVQAVAPSGKAVMGYASANLDDIVADFQRATAASGGRLRLVHEGSSSGNIDGAELGLFGIGKALKKLAKKTGISKVLKTAHKLTDYALKNPLVQGALAATGPMGMSVLAAHKAYGIIQKYKRGSKKALGFIKKVVRSAARGNPKAIAMQRMLRFGKRAFDPGAMARYAVRRPGQPARYGTRQFSSRYRPLCPSGRVAGDLDAIAAADVVELGEWMVAGAYAGGDAQVALSGAEEAELDNEIAELQEFAASAGAWEGIAMLGEDVGAWEGVRWVYDALKPQSMAANPPTLTARGALLDGRQGQAARFG